MQTNKQKKLGTSGECIAANYLIKKGYEIIDRNWRCVYGEIDIIASNAKELIFVEVKTRSGSGYGHPFEAITKAKHERLILLSTIWYDTFKNSNKYSVRLDVISVIFLPNMKITIEHLENLQ